MRELKLRQTAVEALRCAEAGAIAALGKRGGDARDAMKHAATVEARRLADVRWKAIVRSARRSSFDAVCERDVSSDAIACEGPGAQLRRDGVVETRTSEGRVE